MSTPKKHHFLPEFCLSRWAVEGRVYRFTRPRGLAGPVHVKSVAPAGAGYLPDLYKMPLNTDPRESRRIEWDLLSRVETRAARAFAQIETGRKGTIYEFAGLSQFLISLLHRTPGRIEWLSEELARRMGDLVCREADRDWLRESALEVFADLVSSQDTLRVFSSLRVFRIEVTNTRFPFLTSDQPAMLSSGLLDPGGFLMVPMSPQALLIVSKEEAVAQAFAYQDSAALVRAVNDAVVSQAETVVIADSASQLRFIENRFLRINRSIDRHRVDGIVRWQAP